jgi:hypothetical protein
MTWYVTAESKIAPRPFYAARTDDGISCWTAERELHALRFASEEDAQREADERIARGWHLDWWTVCVRREGERT